MTSTNAPSRADAERRRPPVVLIVDDDQTLGEAIVEALELDGLRAIHVDNGRDALALLEDVQPRVLLVDLFMPGMNGAELLRIVRKDPRFAAITCVIMTAANDGMIGVKEDVPVLYKPLDLPALTTMLRRYV
jgi:CheY-like chemotaxis protein